MITLQKALPTILKRIANNIEIILASLIIFVAPLVVNYNDLPKGYEIPKVVFFQISTLILFAIFLARTVFSFTNSKPIRLEKSLVVLIITIVLIIISSLVSPFSNGFDIESLKSNISLVGNSFRLQGAYTHVLMAIFAYIIYKRANRKNVVLIFVALFLSSLIQAGVSFGQLSYFIKVDPKVIFEGYYINGTFGQANFYSGRIMLGILSAIFLTTIAGNFISRFKKFRIALNIIVFALLPISTIFLIIGLFISFSTWGIISSILLVFLLILYEVSVLRKFKKYHFGYLFGVIFSVGLITGAILLTKQYYDNVDNFRLLIWQRIYEISQKSPVQNIIFGFGFDTLGEVFKIFGEFKGLYVDRAHNFFLDIYSQAGLLSLVGFLGLYVLSALKFVFNKSSRTLTYLFIGCIVWIFRSFVHESGIVNLYDFLILFAATLALQKDLFKIRQLSL